MFIHVSRQQRALLVFLIATGLSLLGGQRSVGGQETRNAQLEFQSAIRPIFAKKCCGCHGKKTQKAELDLSRLDGIRKGGESGAIVESNADESLLLQYVLEKTMPPEESPPLTTDEISTISDWVKRYSAELPLDVVVKRPISQKEVLAILRLRCQVCHGRKIQEANLDLRSVASLLKGGKSGPAAISKDPENSLILKRLHAGEMPPRRKLAAFSVKPMTDSEIKMVEAWIKDGMAVIPEKLDVATSDSDPLVSQEERSFWAFQPPRDYPIPMVPNRRQANTSIDVFILKQLNDHGLDFEKMASRSVLIRRLYFDLLGVPPSPEQVKRFVADRSPDAYFRLVEAVLASPDYGERWGQYWLDLCGYSDSEGVQHADRLRAHAFRYRDYVIRAMNSDKPYDRFLLEQIAGDELERYESGEVSSVVYDNLVATGFLRMAPDGTYAGITNFVPDRLEIIDDELEILSSSVMGLTIKCAKCHSHKFDPIPQRDYFRLAAIFKGAWDEHDWLKPSRDQGKPGTFGRYLDVATFKDLEKWKAQGSNVDAQPLVRALWDRGAPSPTYILRRGNYLNLGRRVGPGVPSVLTNGKTPFEIKKPWPDASSTGRRLAFAKWLVQPNHPLTARVIVNRIWHHHFGRGIVKTLDNFGRTGDLPTHPELLDWMAVRFVASGWSIKSLHRLIVTSRVYMQTSVESELTKSEDPENRLFSRFPFRRLEAEAIRDSLLIVADSLDSHRFGKADEIEMRADGLVTVRPSRSHPRIWRKSIYALKRRTQPVTMLQNFDGPTMNPNCTARSESTVAPQALHLINNELVYELSGRLADRIIRDVGNTPETQLVHAFWLLFGRAPSDKELKVCLQSLKSLQASHADRSLGTRTEIIAATELWIRESEPERVFENDLISVWSSHSSDKGRRVGIVEFDTKRMSDLKLTGMHLELAVVGAGPLRQTASLIPVGIEQLNWRKFHESKATSEIPLEQFGEVVTKQSDAGVVKSTSASATDLKRITAKIRSDGRVALALRAVEDGNAYRVDWDDGDYQRTKHLPPKLIVFDSRSDERALKRNALHDLCHTLINTAEFIYID